MEIPGVNIGDPIFGAPETSRDESLGKDSFLRLLVEQLKSQDPLDPAANEEMIAQLAQFSSLEEMQNLNSNILGMTVLQQNNALMSQLMGGSALIGRTVQFSDPVTGEQQSGEVFSVKILDGLAVLNIEGRDVPLSAVSEVTDPVSTVPTDDAAGDTADNDA